MTDASIEDRSITPGNVIAFLHKKEAIRAEHAEWSQATFGNVGPIGSLKHLAKEALEAAENPADLSGWADIQFLVWDAQRRAGISDEQVVEAMAKKLPMLKAREWPAAKEGEPVHHVVNKGILKDAITNPFLFIFVPIVILSIPNLTLLLSLICSILLIIYWDMLCFTKIRSVAFSCASIAFMTLACCSVAERTYLEQGQSYPRWLASGQLGKVDDVALARLRETSCSSAPIEIFQKRDFVVLRCGYFWYEPGSKTYIAESYGSSS